MTEPDTRLGQAWRALRRQFDLRQDQQDADVVDASLRAGAQFGGTNLWVLFFAILIASVGLNVNSTAVIIGAMLISPLMGPIVGAGYGAAVLDVALIRQALKNLLVFAVLSLVTSATYFAISPLEQPQSELIARTSPTFWDVLIALFGGAAGMVAVTRRSYSNIIPGVAIATALMPPLCTVGFGLAHARWDMALGAFYLFTINGICIALAALGIARLLRLPFRGAVNDATRRRHRVFISLGLVVVMLPSAWFAHRVAQDEWFEQGARRVAQGFEQADDVSVIAHDLDVRARRLTLTVLQRDREEAVRKVAIERLKLAGIQDAQVAIRHAGDLPLDVAALRRELSADLQRTMLQQLRQANARTAALDARLTVVEQANRSAATQAAVLASELKVLLPTLHELELIQGSSGVTGVVLQVHRATHAAERLRLTAWLRERLRQPEVQWIEQVRPQPAPPTRRS